MRELYDKQEIIQTSLKMLSDIVDRFHKERDLNVSELRKYLQKELGNVIEEIHQFEIGIEEEVKDK